MKQSIANISVAKLCLIAAASIIANGSQAADIRMNGFLSVGGGLVTDAGKAGDGQGNEVDATYEADVVTNGVYDDDISFRPDSNYGLQITADLSDGLTATGQITGNGGENFDAVISWAYVSYEIDKNWKLTFGRQRLPLFFYSNFIDVGYAYHWIRPPQDLSANDGDTFEGIKLRWTGSLNNWYITADGYYGSGVEEIVSPNFTTETTAEDQHGIVLKVTHDWLTLRGTYSNADSHLLLPGVSFLNEDLEVQLEDDNPLNYSFYGLAGKADFGNVFVVAEFTLGQPEDPVGVFSAVGPTNQVTPATVSGGDTDSSWYISVGYRLGKFTPHITYNEHTQDFIFSNYSPLNAPYTQSDFQNLRETEQKSTAWTIGVRWDFHPSAAAKLEYYTRSDDSEDFYKNNAGPAGIFSQGFGNSLEVDVLSFSLDVIF